MPYVTVQVIVPAGTRKRRSGRMPRFMQRYETGFEFAQSAGMTAPLSFQLQQSVVSMLDQKTLIARLPVCHRLTPCVSAGNSVNGDAAEERGKVVNAIVTVSHCIENLEKHREKLHRISRRAPHLRYGGSTIAREAGDLIIVKMALLNAFASTEIR
ncbi:predicted protein [Plenodomus lingam JN3]|uniref:Predicted protein n=1 Tax=Leptosphaeria maculans (strain JN3 / isolate v23.1.3 / race Av1-4-5-6-7-8) TaxID=985895 RepID=E5AE45_LEPMJ|nr:predicted protein [Plenodomus lingam JN3]CBY01484.1 predicted protein [Plenodomus lingam JN3]